MLVVSISEEADDTGVTDPIDEADVFRLSLFTGLKPGTGSGANRITDYLAHHIARMPGDLRSHVQRINMHLAIQDAGGLYGALLDLFIVLNDGGLALRKRILDSARPVLKLPMYQAMNAVLERGIDATDRMPLSRTSMLSKGLQASNRLVSRTDNAATTTRDLLQEAREHIEYGQIELARDLLEQGVLENPERVELQQDLLEIYASTRDRERFSVMRRRLDAKNVAAGEAWSALETILEEDG
ncbi:MAG TPA: hypothetical protein ENJ80_08230 [Gammaproteobacteria bacterium]|nr:hypothetical protein [Gammaproteobacteria bacterium]